MMTEMMVHLAAAALLLVLGIYILTVELDHDRFAWLDGLHRRHFPPERNFLPAHLKPAFDGTCRPFGSSRSLTLFFFAIVVDADKC